MSSVLPPWPELSCASGVAVRRCTALAALFTRLKSEVAMRIADFLFANFLPQQRATIAFQAGIADHLGAFIRQIWPNGRVLIVAQPRYREYCERKLIAELRAQGVDAPYCLCLEQPGVTPLQQIQESLSDGVLEKLSAIFSLGDNILFKYVREQSSIVGIPCGALLDEFADPHAFDAIAENIPFASAIFFDIDAIAERLKGRTDDAICALETELYSLKADMLAINSFNKPVNKILLDAVEQSAPDRSLAKYAPDEDSLAQLAESYSWFAISCRIFHETQGTSFETVADYVRAAADMPTFTHTQHARLLAQVFDAALEIESLEIDPDACASRQPPKEILTRTLQQTLLEDGVNFAWLKRAEANYSDRIAMRNELNSVLLNWDEFCAHLRAIADVMRAIAADDPATDDLDPALKNAWIHAARFAPKHSYLKLFADMGIVESSLYL